MAKKSVTKARRRGFELQSSELKTIWAHNFSFNWLVLKPILSHFSFLKSLHKKHAFRTFWGLSGGGRSRFYKGLCHYKMQCMTKIIQKLGHHGSNLCFVGERNSEHGFLSLGETWLLDKKSRNLVEWDTFKFRLWLVIACNRQTRCDTSTAQRFWTAIVRAMGQQKWSKRTTSNSIDQFWNQICPMFPSSSLYIDFFDFLGLTLPRNDRESRAKNGLRAQAIC